MLAHWDWSEDLAHLKGGQNVVYNFFNRIKNGWNPILPQILRIWCYLCVISASWVLCKNEFTWITNGLVVKTSDHHTQGPGFESHPLFLQMCGNFRERRRENILRKTSIFCQCDFWNTVRLTMNFQRPEVVLSLDTDK